MALITWSGEEETEMLAVYNFPLKERGGTNVDLFSVGIMILSVVEPEAMS